METGFAPQLSFNSSNSSSADVPIQHLKSFCNTSAIRLFGNYPSCRCTADIAVLSEFGRQDAEDSYLQRITGPEHALASTTNSITGISVAV